MHVLYVVFIRNVFIRVGVNNSASIPMFDISDFPGAQELERVEDGTSAPIHLPISLRFGNEYVKTAYVSYCYGCR